MKVRKITMKQRKFKFSLGMKIASILSCIALVSVGFASWWIVQYPTKSTTSQGSFEVYSVGTKKVEISDPVFNPTTDANIAFGKQLKDDDGNDVVVKWLIADEEVGVQNLDAQFTFNVSMKDVTDKEEGGTEEKLSSEHLNKYLSEITFTLDDIVGSTGADSTALQAAITAGYITGPTVTYSYVKTGESTVLKSGSDDWTDQKIDFSIDTSAASCSQITVTVTITFAWGSTFGGTNPYVYYNGQTYSQTVAGNAQTALKGLYDLNGTKYKVEITAVPGSSAPAAS